MAKTPLALLQGTVDLLILHALRRGPTHGYSISRAIRERSDGALITEDAALYQALHRLEVRGLIASEWGVSENNRRAKYYSLTPRGRAQLKLEMTTWRRYADAMFKVISEMA